MRKTVFALCMAVAFTNPNVNAIVSAEAPAQTIQSLLAEARDAQSRRDFNAAAESYRKAIDLDPSVPELWANLGLMYHESGKPVEAIRSFKEAIKLNASLFVPQLFLGIEYLKSQNVEAAIPFLENAEKLNPNDLQAALNLAKAYTLSNHADLAAEAYSVATRLAPNNGDAWLSLGTAYLQQVENDARVLNSTYGDSAYARLRAAEVLAEQGKLIPSEAAYKDAIALQASAPCRYAEFGIALLRTNEIAKAREEFEREIRGGSHCGLAILGLAVADIVSGDPNRALMRLTPIAKADPSFFRTSLPLFRGTASTDRVRALIDLARSQGSGSSSFDIGSFLEETLLSDDILPVPAKLENGSASDVEAPSPLDAERFYDSGQYTHCSQSLKPVLQTIGSNQLRLLAACSFFVGDFQTTSRAAQRLKGRTETRAQGLYWESKADEYLAIAALIRAGEIDADSPRMHGLLGDVYREQLRWDEAEEEYRKSVALDPNSRSARLSLAITLFSEMKTDEALSLDRAILAEAQNDPEANLLAGEILIQLNRFSEAEANLLRCAALKPELLTRYHTMLGRVYAETNRVPSAIAEYKQGLATDEDGGIHYQLARLYQKTGDKAAANQAFKDAKRLANLRVVRERAAIGQSSADANHQ